MPERYFVIFCMKGKQMYKVLKQEGRAKRAEVTTVHGTIQTPVFMNVGTVAAIKGDDQKTGRTPQIYVVGQADPDGFWRISGLFSGRSSKDQGGGGIFQFPHRRQKDLYGTGGEHADPVESCLNDRHGI